MGTHPIFESDFDCLTDRNRITTWPTQSPPRRLFASEPRSSIAIKLTALCASTNHGENQSVLTPVFAADSRANTLCHQLVMVPRLVTVTDVPIKRTSRSLSLTTLPSWRFDDEQSRFLRRDRPCRQRQEATGHC